MKVKLIKDLDEVEISNFKKSKLYSSINNNWSNTDSYIEYNKEYFNNNFEDQSLVVFMNNEFYIAMISFSNDNILSYFGEPLYIIDSNEYSANLNLAYNVFYKKLSSIKKDHGFNKVYLYENTKIISKFSDSIITNSHNYQMYIDLSQSEELIKMNIRKSFKSLINWGNKNLQIDLIDSRNLDKIKFNSFRDFHAKVSGRKTRSDKTWELQYNAIINNEAYLTIGNLNGLLVSGAYIVHGTGIACYGVAVNDRELMAEKLPIGHSILFNSIIQAKKKGLNKFVVGDYSYVEDEKINAITKYKKGFVNSMSLKPKYLIEL
jgi:hypothetical protein